MCRDGIVGASLIYPFTHQPRHGQDRIGGPDPLLTRRPTRGPSFILLFSSLFLVVPLSSTSVPCIPPPAPRGRSLPPSSVVDNYLSPVYHQPRFPIVRRFSFSHRARGSRVFLSHNQACVFPLVDRNDPRRPRAGAKRAARAAILARDFQVSNRCWVVRDALPLTLTRYCVEVSQPGVMVLAFFELLFRCRSWL